MHRRVPSKVAWLGSDSSLFLFMFEVCLRLLGEGTGVRFTPGCLAGLAQGLLGTVPSFGDSGVAQTNFMYGRCSFLM